MRYPPGCARRAAGRGRQPEPGKDPGEFRPWALAANFPSRPAGTSLAGEKPVGGEHSGVQVQAMGCAFTLPSRAPGCKNEDSSVFERARPRPAPAPFPCCPLGETGGAAVEPVGLVSCPSVSIVRGRQGPRGQAREPVHGGERTDPVLPARRPDHRGLLAGGRAVLLAHPGIEDRLRPRGAAVGLHGHAHLAS